MSAATNIDEALALLDAAEQRQRDDARRAAQTTRQPATPEPDEDTTARWLADRLQANASQWTTLRP